MKNPTAAPVFLAFVAFCSPSPIKEGLQQDGEGCDGRQVQVSLRDNKLRIFQFAVVFLVCDFSEGDGDLPVSE